MSRLVWSVLAIGLVACSDAVSPRAFLNVPIRPILVDSGGALKISAVVTNLNNVPVTVANTELCQFTVQFYPDSIQQSGTSVPGELCFAAPRTDLAPRDSLIVTGVVPPFTLAQIPPGLYTVQVSLALDSLHGITTAGEPVRLPLSSTP